MKNESISSSELYAMVINASDIIAPVWPMKTIIACNPLQGLETLNFEEAIQKGRMHFGIHGYQSVHDQENISYKDIYLLSDMFMDDKVNNKVNEELIKWLSVFLDEGQANITMPNRAEGFFKSWRALVSYDEKIHQNHAYVLKWLDGLPNDASEALTYALNTIGKPQTQWEEYLRISLSKLNGWSGFIKWRSKSPDYKYQQLAPISLMDYLAVRLAIECCICIKNLNIEAGVHLPIFPYMLTRYNLRSKSASKGIKTSDNEFIQELKKQEQVYRLPLLKQIQEQAKVYYSEKSTSKCPKAQMVFCIDVRSEPFRRAIEALGEYKSFGFAGFFALPIRVHSFRNHDTCDSCPVLLKPRHDIYEEPSQVTQNRIKKYEEGETFLNRLKDLYNQLKFNVATPFVLAEGFGPWCGLMMLGRTIFPDQFIDLKEKAILKLKPDIKTQHTLQIKKDNLRLEGISFSEQALYAEAFLRMIGLTSNFAPVVLLCGHGSLTENNPYASALDCGACGGNHGGANARVMAAILNDPKIREELNIRQIEIPKDSLFLGAEHNTTTDELEFLDDIPISHSDRIKILMVDLMAAQENNSRWRLKNFGISDRKQSSLLTKQRSRDWAQVRPEWGLARNAAFIVGPRELTEAIELEGRCFLHSYDWRQDETGKSLETILTAPMVVAQWINGQYFFSTVDNVAYGSGSKVTHNVVGKLGVMQGNASDLMHGLPLQSVYRTDESAYHDPLRLMTVVYAPLQRVKDLIDKHEVLQKLFYKEWVSLKVIEPTTSLIYSLKPNGEWEAV